MILINMSDLLLLREMNLFWVGGKTEGLFTSPLRADQMSPAGTSLLGTTALAKSIEKNRKQWEKMDSEWRDQVKKDESLHSSVETFSRSFMSLSITQ